MDTLDTWLNFRETTLKEADLGDSIDMVEELIRKHDDFEKAVLAQEGKFGDIKRLTLVGFSHVFFTQCECHSLHKEYYGCGSRTVLESGHIEYYQ